MFRITRDPSSGSFIQCLAKITVMVLSCPFNGHDRTITITTNSTYSTYFNYNPNISWIFFVVYRQCNDENLFYVSSLTIRETPVIFLTVNSSDHYCNTPTTQYYLQSLECDTVKWTGRHKEDKSLKRTMCRRTENRPVQHLDVRKNYFELLFPNCLPIFWSLIVKQCITQKTAGKIPSFLRSRRRYFPANYHNTVH